MYKRCIQGPEDHRIHFAVGRGFSPPNEVETTAENGGYVNLVCMDYTKLFSDQFEGLRMEIIEFFVKLTGQVSLTKVSNDRGFSRVNKLGKVLQWLGFILIALGPFFALEDTYANYLPILMISGSTLALLGSLLSKPRKLEILAICLGILSLIAYFYLDQRLIYKILIITSLVLVVVQGILDKKNHHSK